MLKFLRSNQQIFTVFIFAYCLITVFSIYFSHPESVYSATPFHTPFFGDITDYLFTSGHKVVGFTILTFIALVFCGFYLVRININHNIIPKRSQFPALFLISISSLAFRHEMFSSVLIASFFLLFAIDRLFGAIHKQGLTYRFLDAGILIGLGSLFYFNLIFFFPFLWLAQFTLKPLNLREFLFTLVGLTIPFIYLFSVYFLLDISIVRTFDLIGEWLVLKKLTDITWPFLGGILFYLLIMFFTNIYAVNKFAKTKIYTRKLFQLWFYLFLNALIIFLVIPASGIEMLLLMAIPVSVLLSIYFTECRNSIINRIILLLLLATPIVISIIW